VTAISLKGIGRSFGNNEILRNVDLDIADGEFVVFVGPSGCGKSTLLRMIAGLDRPTIGRIEIGDRDVTDKDASERGIAMVFQSYALYPHMTVEQNIGFGLRMAGTPRQVVANKVHAVAGTLQLSKLLDRKPAQLSGGQRQRVAIGRAIIRNPGVFLFDEPLSNLDAELRVQMRAEISQLHRQIGKTMIYVTHDQVEAMTLADRIVVLRQGGVEQIGTPLELYDEPANKFVAEFIGSPKTNMTPAVLGDGNAVILPLLGKAAFEVKSVQLPKAAVDLTLGIRPEKFRSDGSVKLSLLVEKIEHLGSTSYIYAISREGQQMTVEMRGGRSVSSGDMIETSFNPEDAYLFDSVAGKRLA